MKVDIIPYTEVDGIRTFRDSQIMELVDKMFQDGTYDEFLSIPPSQFMDWLKTARNAELLIVLVDGSPGGLVLIENKAFRHGFIHLCVFSEFWGKYEILDGAAAIVLDAVMPNFSVLVSIVREDNEHVQNFNHRLGLKPVATIPGYFHDITTDRSVSGIMYLISKEALHGRK